MGLFLSGLWLKFSVFLFVLSLVSCDSSDKKNGDVKLATSDDLPLGQQAEPGSSSGIYLGHYNTCKEYSDYVLKQLNRPPLGAFLNPDQPVNCKKAHTCHCMDGKYFIEDFRGAGTPVYRCVEQPSAQVESAKVYQSDKPGKGVIKFALPRSLCEGR